MWFDGWKLGASMMRNGLALQETLLAAQGVINHRKAIIAHAVRHPFDADVAELHRMGDEKVEAFGKAGATMAKAWFGIHADMLSMGQDFAIACASSWPDSRAPLERMSRRGSKMALKASLASGRALAPVRAAATANGHRLSRSRAAR